MQIYKLIVKKFSMKASSNSSKIFFKDKKNFVQSILILFIIFLVILLAWFKFDFLEQKNNEDSSVINQNIENIQENISSQKNDEGNLDSLIEKVSKHVLLPSGQIQVYTINDANKLRQGNQIFKYIKDGDRLIIGDDRIIMYDPIKDKVIDLVSKY